MIYEYDVVFGRWRSQRQPWKWIPVMNCGFGGTRFSSIIYDSQVVYGRWRFSFSRGTGFRWWFMVWRDLVFVNDLWFSCSPWALKISRSAVELGSGDDFWVLRDAVFVNHFWFWRSLWAQMIQRQPWNWVPVMISRSGGTPFSSMIYESDVVFGRWRSQRQPWNWVPVMIFRSGGTEFWSMISDSDIVYGR